MRSISISVQFARAVLKHAVSRDLDPIALLRKNRISPRLLLEDDARISVERFADLQVSTMIAMQDELLGYGSARMPLGTWSMMCHAVIGSATLGQALSRYCRFYQLFECGVQPTLEEQADCACLSLVKTDPAAFTGSYLDEFFLFNVHRFSNWLVQTQLPLQAVELQHTPTAGRQEYREVFLGSPVQFEQAQSRLLFANALLELPISQNETSLRHFQRHPALLLLSQDFASRSWSARVRKILRHSMDALPEFGEVATQLQIHPQTLRRRLTAEGTSFKEIKSQLRRDTSLHFLGKQGLSIEEIAQRAGFSESSAFIRAFKGWTGVTPYTYRKGL